MKTLVKICGITNSTDAGIVCRSGADYIGVLLEVTGSPRSISQGTASQIVSSSGLPVVVLMDKQPEALIAAAIDLRPYALQLVGTYSPAEAQAIKKAVPCELWQTLRIPQEDYGQMAFTDLLKSVTRCQESGVAVIVLDTLAGNRKGGTGKVCDWRLAARLVSVAPVPIFLAGGITPENVGAAMTAVKPRGIDLSSGVEQRPGIKDPAKVTALMQQIQTIGGV
jgi:phosphoribosylanthranilate isomerase